MSKERLEDIKTWLNRGFDLTEEDINWLIKQAERVQKLEDLVEDYITINKELHKRGKKIRKQNQRYREALENIVNSYGWLIEPNPFCTIEEAYERCVDEAEKALEGKK